MGRWGQGFTVSMWHGSLRDLETVVEECRVLRADALARAEARAGRDRAERARGARERAEVIAAALAADPGFADEGARARFLRAVELLRAEDPGGDPSGGEPQGREGRRRSPELRLTARRSSGEEMEGDPEAVLPRLRARGTAAVRIRCEDAFAEPHLSVGFDRYGGVRVRAASADTEWVTTAVGRLRRVLGRRRPWYAPLARPWVAYPLCWAAAVNLSLQLGLLWGIPWGEALYWIALVLGLGAALAAAWTGFFFRAFELSGPGGVGRGKPLVGGLVLAAALVPWSVLAGGWGS